MLKALALIPKWHILQVALAMVLAACLSFVYTTVWDWAYSYPYSLDYEGHVLWACLSLAQGKNIYDPASLTTLPWSVIIYNPLYFAAGAALISQSVADFSPLRLISMVSTLLTFLGLFVVMKRSACSDFQATTGLVLFGSSLPVLFWSSTARVDALGLCLAVWGVERLMAASNNAGQRKLTARELVASITLFVLAYFTKQQYMVFAAAAALWFAAGGRRALALKFAGIWLASTAAIAICIQFWTGGYLSHLAYAARLPWEWETLKQFLLPFLTDPKTVASAAIIVAALMIGRRGAQAARLAAILLAVSFCTALVTMGVRAAYHNHLLCTQLALAWLTAASLAKLRPWLAAIPLTAAAASLALIGDYLWELGQRYQFSDYTQATVAWLKARNLSGQFVLSEDPSLALLCGAKPAIIDATTLMNVCRSDPRALAPFVREIEQNRFPVVIINRPDAHKRHQRIWPESVVSAIKSRYKRVCTTSGNGTSQDVFILSNEQRQQR